MLCPPVKITKTTGFMHASLCNKLARIFFNSFKRAEMMGFFCEDRKLLTRWILLTKIYMVKQAASRTNCEQGLWSIDSIIHGNGQTVRATASIASVAEGLAPAGILAARKKSNTQSGTLNMPRFVGRPTLTIGCRICSEKPRSGLTTISGFKWTPPFEANNDLTWSFDEVKGQISFDHLQLLFFQKLLLVLISGVGFLFSSSTSYVKSAQWNICAFRDSIFPTKWVTSIYPTKEPTVCPRNRWYLPNHTKSTRLGREAFGLPSHGYFILLRLWSFAFYRRS